MTRDTPRGLGPPPPADATDPSVLAEITDPDGLSFDAETATEPGEAVDALAAFEQRRRIYPQAAGSPSSDGSVAASYHAVHDVPRAHHDTLPNAVSSAPVVVDIVTERVPPPLTEPVTVPLPRSAPERAVGRGRDVSTFPLPRERLRRPVLIAVLAALAGVVALLVVFVLRAAGGPLEQGTTVQRAAASEVAPLVVPSPPVVPPPSAPSATAPANDVARAPAAPATTSPARELLPVRPIASSALHSRPSALPPSTPSNATPATARPAGAFDDLVRETKP